jgi:hypothetical protein
LGIEGKETEDNSSATLSLNSSTLTLYPATATETDSIYDPHFIDDPDLKTGKHRTVLNLPGFRVI